MFLYYLGIKTFISRPVLKGFRVSSSTLISSYISSLFLTITNPLTILSFAAVFVGSGAVNKTTNYNSASILVLGVFLGSACWWLILSGSVGLLRKRLDPQMLRSLNRFSGIILLFAGFMLLNQLLINWSI